MSSLSLTAPVRASLLEFALLVKLVTLDVTVTGADAPSARSRRGDQNRIRPADRHVILTIWPAAALEEPGARCSSRLSSALDRSR